MSQDLLFNDTVDMEDEMRKLPSTVARAEAQVAVTVVEPMFLTARQVADHLALKKSRVYELAASGVLPMVRLGRRILFPRRGLEAMVDAAIERAKIHQDDNRK